MQPNFVYTNPNVQQNIGKAAVMRGPLVYCAEEIDNSSRLGAYALRNTDIHGITAPDGLPDGTEALEVPCARLNGYDDSLYTLTPPASEEAKLKMIPYHLWANRGENEMRVFFNMN
jgi:DUF1680 family protein